MAKIGWVRASPRYPAEIQRTKLKAWGATKLYELGRDGVGSVTTFIRQLRPSDLAGTVGIHRFAETMKALGMAMEAISRKNVTVADIEIDVDLAPTAVKWAAAYANAKRVYDGEARGTPEEMKERGTKGGKAAAKKTRVPFSKEHYAMWKDVRGYGTNLQAAQAVSADLGRYVSVPTLRRRFGNSGRMAGWPGPAKAPLPEIPIKPPRPKRGVVYFMRIGGKGPVKIGYAGMLKSRLSSHQTSHHRKLEIVAAMMGTKKTEGQLHKRFAALRVKGRREWFRMTGDLKVFIEALPQLDDSGE